MFYKNKGAKGLANKTKNLCKMKNVKETKKNFPGKTCFYREKEAIEFTYICNIMTIIFTDPVYYNTESMNKRKIVE